MPATYEPIATTTLSTTASTVSFTSISGSYTDLIAVFVGTTTTGVEARVRFNTDSGNNYSYTYLAGDGSSAISGRGSSGNELFITTYGTPSTTQGNFIMHVQNYSNATTYKTVLVRGNRITAGFGPEATVGLWRSTSAITNIEFRAGSTTWASGSTFTLYGIKAA
jgi:hypothetical protein